MYNKKVFLIFVLVVAFLVPTRVSAVSELLFFGIIRNYDNTGRPNGYLFYQAMSSVAKSRILSTQTQEHATKACQEEYRIVKYTYENYPVEKETTTEGNITVSNENAYPGELVKVSVVAKEGYVLKRIVVLDESGKEIEVSKDGTFVMPEGKVTVTAIYSRISNPETVSACYVVLGIILLISIGTLIVQKKKENV